MRRHGNRLDAANKQWHLQSPTPYDPPLTYSGWNQARATGQRIAEILREREVRDENAANTDGIPRKRRKFQVVIHSSPFLRCVQTSIGISAGLASIPEPKLDGTPSTNPGSRPSMNVDVASPSLSSAPSQPYSDLPTPPETDSRPTSPKKLHIEKTVLRLDAFLGEWLTPGYFELITPPPGSSLMLASAKASLLRKEDYSNNPNFASYNNATSIQNWAQVPTPTSPVSGTDSMSSLAEALRRAGRSDSVTSVISNGESRLMTGGAYVAPVPTYAISHNAEIPNGYVPHARDNCCKVDYQWDSMRGALDWGDGGKLGEEWTSMHQRFRKGLQKLVDWYSVAENPTQMVTKERRQSLSDDYVMVEDEDVEVESVVILVSHGAGCNALIGAITHKPVLTDVGLASLTEAERKPGVSEVEGDGSRRFANGSSNTVSEPSGLVAIHEYYGLKLFASSEHLSSNRSARAQSMSASMNGSMNPPSRGRLSNAVLPASPLGTNGGTLFSPSENTLGRSPSINVASLRRDSDSSSRSSGRLGLNTSGWNSGITVGSGMKSFLRQTPAAGAGGLWSPLRNTLDSPVEDDDDFLPNFSNFDSAAPSTTAKTQETAEKKVEDKPEGKVQGANRPITPKLINGDVGTGRNRSDSRISPRTNVGGISTYAIHEEEEENHGKVSALPQLGSGAGGLWGSPRPLVGMGEDIPRDLSSSKRRWTVTERW